MSFEEGDRVRPYNVPSKQCTVTETGVSTDVDTDGDTIRIEGGDTLLTADDGTHLVVSERLLNEL